MNNSFFRPLIVLALVLGLGSAHAQNVKTKGPAKVATPNKPQILDFENDVIGGDRKRPDLFSQAGGQNLTLDAILYLRNDFNDYQQIEQGRQPGYFEERK